MNPTRVIRVAGSRNFPMGQVYPRRSTLFVPTRQDVVARIWREMAGVKVHPVHVRQHMQQCLCLMLRRPGDAQASGAGYRLGKYDDESSIAVLRFSEKRSLR